MKSILLVKITASLVLLANAAKAQIIQPIYTFTNSGFTSPRNPYADLVIGPDGNLYGTTEYGGTGGFGPSDRMEVCTAQLLSQVPAGAEGFFA
jgi:hypothetical protein